MAIYAPIMFSVSRWAGNVMTMIIMFLFGRVKWWIKRRRRISFHSPSFFCLSCSVKGRRWTCLTMHQCFHMNLPTCIISYNAPENEWIKSTFVSFFFSRRRFGESDHYLYSQHNNHHKTHIAKSLYFNPIHSFTYISWFGQFFSWYNVSTSI